MTKMRNRTEVVSEVVIFVVCVTMYLQVLASRWFYLDLWVAQSQ